MFMCSFGPLSKARATRQELRMQMILSRGACQAELILKERSRVPFKGDIGFLQREL